MGAGASARMSEEEEQPTPSDGPEEQASSPEVPPFVPAEKLSQSDHILLEALDYHKSLYICIEKESGNVGYTSSSFRVHTGTSDEAIGKPWGEILGGLAVEASQVTQLKEIVEGGKDEAVMVHGNISDKPFYSQCFVTAFTKESNPEEALYMCLSQEILSGPVKGISPSRNLANRVRLSNLCTTDRPDGSSLTKFTPYKKLTDSDQELVDVLQDRMEMFCITDPALHDNPIVYVSDDFVDMTGYQRVEINGINCRFLQGEQTSQEDIDVIRRALTMQEKNTRVTLLNYRKDGTRFINQFHMSPLREEDGRLAYFIGVQIDVEDVDIVPFPNSRQTMAEMLLEEEEEGL